MNTAAAKRFDDYFEQLHGYSPYPWQQRLAARAMGGEWPGAIDLPTGTGKTACLEIAVFALAYQASLPIRERTAPRRIFFCVNRRVIVDEAYRRARHIAEKIWAAEKNGDGVLAEIAASLRTIAGTSGRLDDIPPLDVLELRGGIYRDNRWARSTTQPTIICTTLDQLGSRLLFRGYGVSPNAAPIHAALIAYDSLVLLDEAHISEPFRQTLDFVTRYLDPAKWAERSIGIKPVVVVPMTATPNEAMHQRGVIQLEDEDRAIEALRDRLVAPKPATLLPVPDIVDAVIKAACENTGNRPVSVGIIVNRVSTARAIYDSLVQLQGVLSGKTRKIPFDAIVELVIGSMRPIDRDEQAERLRQVVGPDRPKPYSERTSFVVATQCLEVGADYDFDVLITECASLDSLRQRFGRLNRSGRKGNEGKHIDAKAVILADKKSIKPDGKLDNEKPLDPIYGNALARTWNWLEAIGGSSVQGIDFGIDSFHTRMKQHGGSGQPAEGLLSPSASLNAPVMMPAYIDLWSQTAPRPAPDPDVSLFIHGPQAGEPDVQVCWRADIGYTENHPTRNQWCDVVALLPPTSAECMCVPITRMRRWLLDQEDSGDDTGDVMGLNSHDEAQETQNRRLTLPVVLWRGARQSKLLESVNDLKPGDTIVLSADIPYADLIGYLPELYIGNDNQGTDEAPKVRDHSETAYCRARDRAALRLHPALRDLLGLGFEDILADGGSLQNEPIRHEQWRNLLKATAETLPDQHELKRILAHLSASRLHVELYPDRRGVVLTSRQRIGSSTDWFMPPSDEGNDETSMVQREDAVLLSDHSRHVVEAARISIQTLALTVSKELIEHAAEYHDLGKADERFQAMLRRSDRTDAWLLSGTASAIWAKSDGLPQTRGQRREIWRRAGLPDSFRHEMLSLQLLECGTKLPEEQTEHDLLLHLVAAHHGYARPFAPVVLDEELPGVVVNGLTLTHKQRAMQAAPHRLDSGIAERFWRLTRCYGWWGLAYLEAVLRLADQQASADEDAGRYSEELTQERLEVEK